MKSIQMKENMQIIIRRIKSIRMKKSKQMKSIRTENSIEWETGFQCLFNQT